jgi:hypothetical protein
MCSLVCKNNRAMSAFSPFSDNSNDERPACISFWSFREDAGQYDRLRCDDYQHVNASPGIPANAEDLFASYVRSASHCLNRRTRQRHPRFCLHAEVGMIPEAFDAEAIYRGCLHHGGYVNLEL